MIINRQPDARSFVALPNGEAPRWCWPTLRSDLIEQPDDYFARTPANPAYGRPGWTRDGGKRFHRGCDIAPVRTTKGERTIRLMFTDLATGREYPVEQEERIPDDEVFAIADGIVAATEDDPAAADFGRYIVLAHRWPQSGRPFHTLYAHLDSLCRSVGDTIAAGDRLGAMGRTSRSEDARNWMYAFPHLHFEAWDEHGAPYPPDAFLIAGLSEPLVRERTKRSITL